MPDLLTAPEYATLLAAGRPSPADDKRAALVDLLARGALRLETRRLPASSGARAQERLLVAGLTPASELPDVLRPALAALDAARPVADGDGRSGVRVRDWAGGLAVVTEGKGYLDGAARPALVRAGLLDRVRRRFLPGRRWVLTAEGTSVARSAAQDVARVRQAVRPPDDGWDADPRLAAAAVAALGAMGALALADRGLVDALLDLRRAAGVGGDASPPLWWGGGLTGGDPAGGLTGSDPWCDPFDGLDCLDGGGLDFVDAGTSDGGWDGGDSGGGDGGDGGGGGGGGGD